MFGHTVAVLKIIIPASAFYYMLLHHPVSFLEGTWLPEISYPDIYLQWKGMVGKGRFRKMVLFHNFHVVVNKLSLDLNQRLLCFCKRYREEEKFQESLSFCLPFSLSLWECNQKMLKALQSFFVVILGFDAERKQTDRAGGVSLQLPWAITHHSQGWILGASWVIISSPHPPSDSSRGGRIVLGLGCCSAADEQQAPT